MRSRLPSVRLAYQLMIASSVDDAFGGAELTKDAPNTAPARDQLERWARLCEAAFVEHLNHLPEAKEITTAHSLYQLQQLMIHNLQQDNQLASTAWR